MNKKIIGNRYQFIQGLGSTDSSTTFVAEDLQQSGRFVIKHGSADLPRQVLVEEAKKLEKLGNHAQIPRLKSYFVENGQIYIVQELIEGIHLSKELKPNFPWHEEKLVEMLIDCLQVISFIHSFQVIHGDVKPSNIIRRSDGKPIFVGFRTVMGTHSHEYTPNEQITGNPKPNSDIYALGIIAIQAATGLMPSNLIWENGEIIWRDQAVNIGSTLINIISKMVMYDYHDRYQSAGEVMTDVSELFTDYSLTRIAVRPQPIELITPEAKEQINLEKPLNPVDPIVQPNLDIEVNKPLQPANQFSPPPQPISPKSRLDKSHPTTLKVLPKSNFKLAGILVVGISLIISVFVFFKSNSNSPSNSPNAPQNENFKNLPSK